MCRAGILLKQNEKLSKEFEPFDIIEINFNFKFNRLNCNLSSPIRKMKKMKEEMKEIEELVESQRIMIIETVLIRILKARKIIKHS